MRKSNVRRKARRAAKRFRIAEANRQKNKNRDDVMKAKKLLQQTKENTLYSKLLYSSVRRYSPPSIHSRLGDDW